MNSKSSTETKDILYTGTLSLTGAHPSIAVSDCGKKIKCTTTMINEGQVAVISHCSQDASVQALLSARVHRDVTERVAAFLTVPQRECARRASKALWKAVTAASMEDMLRATVLVHEDNHAVSAQLVVVAMSRVSAPFPCGDALVAWSGGLGPLYDELQLRFPHAAAIAVSARLAAIRPFPFASGCATMTVCVVTAAASPSSLVMESVVLGVHNTTNVLVRTLSHNGAPCPILCLEGATPDTVRALEPCKSLQSVCLANLPLLESIESHAFAECVHLSSVDLCGLSFLRTIGNGAFQKCKSLQSISLVNLPHLESIGDYAFLECAHLSSVDLSDLPALRSIGEGAFRTCKSLHSISRANLPLLESIGNFAFAECVHLLSMDLCNLPSLRTIGKYAFWRCRSLQSISLANLPRLESLGDHVFFSGVHLSNVDLSDLPFLRTIGEGAFNNCMSLQSVSLANLPHLESIGDSAFAECVSLSSVVLSHLPSLRTVGEGAFNNCLSLQSTTVDDVPLLKSIGHSAFQQQCA